MKKTKNKNKVTTVAADEATRDALKKLAEDWKLPVMTFSAEELECVPGTYTDSEFVKKTAGVGNVCERAAVLALSECFSGEVPEDTEGFDDRSLLVRKQAENGVTAAVAGLPSGNGFRRKVKF